MERFVYKIKDKEGIHARPAGIVVKKAKEFESDISIENKGKKVNAKGIFAVMSLAAKYGEEIVITIEGSDEKFALAEMKKVLEENI